MPKLSREDLTLETGLANDFDGAISDVSFEENPDYSRASGTSDPMLKLKIDSPDLPEPVNQSYSLGGNKKWKANKDASEVTSEVKPDSHRFNMNARAGILVDRMFDLIGKGDKVKGQDFFIKRDMYMTERGFYLGLNFHWAREKMKTVGGTETEVLLPSAFLGETTTSGAKSSAPESSGADLDKIVTDLSAGKTERELKATAVKNATLKALANAAYLRDLVSGTKLKTLQDSGALTLGPDGKFI